MELLAEDNKYVGIFVENLPVSDAIQSRSVMRTSESRTFQSLR